MKKLRWPILIALLAVVAIAALLLGKQPSLSPIEPVIEPATGGVYTEGLIGAPVRFNPLLDTYNPLDRDVDRLLFSGLVKFDDRGLPQADLADSWGISRDGNVYNFSLRQNAVWHDGAPVTSDDVIFTIERMREDGSPVSQDLKDFWKGIDIQRLDDKILQFRLPEPFAPFLDYLTFGVLPEHLLGELSLAEIIDAPFNLSPVGSGPYRFEQLLTEDGQIRGIVLRAFKDYYSQPPFIEQFTFRYFPDAGSAFAAYQQGEVLGLGDVPLEILPNVLAAPNLNLHTGRLPALSMLIFNLSDQKVKFFQDVSVRQALWLGMNRQWMIDRILGGQAILADGPIFPGTWAYYDGVKRVEFDPDAAVALLKEAGYTIPAAGGTVRQNDQGEALAFELLYPDTDQHRAIAEAIRRDYAKLGVEVTLKALPYDELVTSLNNRVHQAALIDLNLSRSPDPDPYPFWHQAQITGGQNYSMWDDRQASEYLEQARTTVDIAERTRLYRNFQVRFEKELPALPLFYPVYRYAVDAQVQGVRMGPLFDPSDRFNTVTNWFLVTKRNNSGEAGSASPTNTSVP